MTKKTPAAVETTASALDSAILAERNDVGKLNPPTPCAGNKPPRRNERRKARDRKRWPARESIAKMNSVDIVDLSTGLQGLRPCYSRVKPKGPVLNTPQITRLQPPPKSGVLSCPNSAVPGFPGAAWFLGKMGLSARLAARRDPCVQHLAHPSPLNRRRVASESHHGAKTMTKLSLVRPAAPVITASPSAAPILSDLDTRNPETIALHIAAENALSMALSMLRNPAGTVADLERATARACRAATLLKRACSAAQEGGAA